MNFAGLLKALGWLTISFLYAYIFGGRVPYFIFYTSLGVLAAAFLCSRVNSRVAGHCYTEAVTAQAGRKVKVIVEVKNNSGWPLPWVQYWIQMPGTFCLPDNLGCYTFSLGPHEKKVISEDLECKLRGNYTWGHGLIKTGDIFGIFTRAKQNGEHRQITVLPEVCDLGPDLGVVAGLQFGETAVSLHTSRSGTGYLGVRRYDAGDPMSRIHWKASARTQHLLVKEFQEQELMEFCIYLDLNEDNHAGSGPGGSLEKAVSLAASLAFMGMRSGYGVGLIAFGPERKVIPVGYGKGNFNLILKTLVDIQPGKGFNFGEVVGHELPLLRKNRCAMVITGRVDGRLAEGLAWLKARGQESSVFALKTETFGSTGVDTAEQAGNVSRLKITGIPVAWVAKDSDLRLTFRGLDYEIG